jgi:hypothetical protein
MLEHGEYTKPAVVDYGDLTEMTQALGYFGAEDGASKVVPPHHNPFPASLPVG